MNSIKIRILNMIIKQITESANRSGTNVDESLLVAKKFIVKTFSWT